MGVSVSFSENQIHEARTREDRKCLDVQMEEDSFGLLLKGFRVTHSIPGNWDAERRVFDSVQVVDFVCSTAPSERMLGVSGRYVVRRAGRLSELSGIVDSVTGESFERLRGVSPQLDTAWGTASARTKMALEAEPQHQKPTWERLIMAAMAEAADRNAYMAYPAEAHQEYVVERGPIDDPTEIGGSLCPGQKCPKQRKWNRRSWTNSCCQA